MSSAADQITTGPAPPAAQAGEGPEKKPLGLWDAVSIIVGIVVGAGIFQTAPAVLGMARSAPVALIAWCVGGVISVIGAVCYAELASAYPRDGGDIVYLSRAFGRWCGFLFAWVKLTVVLTGSIGTMAFVFANYAARLFRGALGASPGPYTAFAFAGGAIAVLTFANAVGAVAGKTVQNVLTLAKVLGLGAVVVASVLAPTPGAFEAPDGIDFYPPAIGVALVLILFTYGGWSDAAFVAAEVKDGEKNITRSLIIGTLAVTLLYLLVNAAYISSLGFRGAAASGQVAADVLNRGFGQGGVALMCVLVMVSSLGAVNGLIYAGARAYATAGKEFAVLAWMGGEASEGAAPLPALLCQGALSLALVFLVGTDAGRNGINQLLDLTAVRGDERPVLLDDGSEGAAVAPAGHLISPIDWEGTPAKTFQALATPAPAPEGADEAEKEEARARLKRWGAQIEDWKKRGAYPEQAGPLAAALVGKGLLSREEADGWLREAESEASRDNLAGSGFDTLVACTAPMFWLFFLLTGLSLCALRQRDRDVRRPFRVPLYPTLPLLFCLSSAYVLYSSVAYALEQRLAGGVFLLGMLPLAVGLPLYHLSVWLGDAPEEGG